MLWEGGSLGPGISRDRFSGMIKSHGHIPEAVQYARDRARRLDLQVPTWQAGDNTGPESPLDSGRLIQVLNTGPQSIEPKRFGKFYVTYGSRWVRIPLGCALT